MDDPSTRYVPLSASPALDSANGSQIVAVQSQEEATSRQCSEQVLYPSECFPHEVEGNSDKSLSGKSTPAIPSTEHELRNMLLLSLVFTVYFGFRSGCLIVLPLACKQLLHDELGGVEHSPLYQLPLALWFVMDMLIAAPNAVFMRRHGRRLGFMIGSLCAFIASCAAFCILRFMSHDVWLAYVLINIAVVLLSVIGMAEFVRFAAAEACADTERKAAVVSRVISGGAILSMVGPFSASAAQLLGDGQELSGFAFFFLFVAGFAVISFVAASALKLPATPEKDSSTEIPLIQILRRSKVWSAIFAQVVVQFAMVAPMSGSPLEMNHSAAHGSGASFLVSCCIVAHVLAMFMPGIWTGSAIAYFGVFRVMSAGVLVQIAGGVVLLTDRAWANFYVGLALIGVGWNLSFVSGTVLLLASHSPEERTKVTSTNETLRFMANFVAVLLSSTLEWPLLVSVAMALALLTSLAVVLAHCQATASPTRES